MNLFFWKVQDDVLFKYRLDCAAVAQLKEVSSDDKFFPYPELVITFCLLEVSSNAKQPA